MFRNLFKKLHSEMVPSWKLNLPGGKITCAQHIHVHFFYQEAHAMVRAANVKKAAAEKKFKEANNKVGGSVTFARS